MLCLNNTPPKTTKVWTYLNQKDEEGGIAMAPHALDSTPNKLKTFLHTMSGGKKQLKNHNCLSGHKISYPQYNRKPRTISISY